MDVAIITPFYDFVKQIHCVKIGLHFLYNTIFLFLSETGRSEKEKKNPVINIKKSVYDSKWGDGLKNIDT